MQDSKKTNLILVFIGFIIVCLAILLGKNVTQAHFSKPTLLILGLTVALLTLTNTEITLYLIIFSMLLSPELRLGAIAGRDIALRLEDFLLMIVAFSWLVKTGINKELSIFKRTPLNLAIGIYVLTSIVLTLRGMFFGAATPAKAIFYLVKYIEYFILYFIVINHVQSRHQIKRFVFVLLLTCAIVVTYTNLHIGEGRLSAPFEEEAEPNTFGGYLLFMLAITMGILLYTNSFKVKFCLMLLSLFIIPSFLYTLSRTSYLAIIPMWIGLIIFGPRKGMLTAILLLAVLLGIFFMPQPVRERIEYTFVPDYAEEQRPITIGRVGLGPSISDRIYTWRYCLERWEKSPLVGHGVTAVGFVDGQYIRVLAELGLVGLFSFLFLLWSLFKNARAVFLKMEEDNFFKGLSLGFLVGLMGIICFNVGANGFIVTRIMEPFWFVAAMVMLLPQIKEQEQEQEQGQEQE